MAPGVQTSRAMPKASPLWLIACVTAPAVAHADRVITLDDALAMARTHNRDLRASRARVDQTATAIEQQRAQLLPNITAQGKYTHNYKEVSLDLGEFTAPTTGLADTIRTTTTTPAEAAAIGAFEQQTAAQLAAQPPIVIQKEEQLDFGITGTLPLVAPATWYGLSAAKATQRANVASYDASEASVLVSVAQAYYGAAGADELVAARDHAVALAKDTLANARARVAADVANQVDVTRAETALVRAEQDQAEADTSRAAAYRSLQTLLGTHEHLQVQTIPVMPPPTAPVASLVANAAATRPELAADRDTIAAADANARAGGWRWAPTLSAFANYRAFNYTGFSGDKYSWAAGLELDWTLYDGGARDAARHLADAQRTEAQARLELAADTIADEVANAADTLATKQRAVTAAVRQVELATETLRLLRAQYDAGTVKQLDVLQAQDSLVTAEVALAQAHFDLGLADVQLKRAAGTSLLSPASTPAQRTTR
jgi:outer membrane protein TolC